jgi:translation elongation factor EF-1beta
MLDHIGIDYIRLDLDIFPDSDEIGYNKVERKIEKMEKDRYQKQTQVDHVTDGNEA